jgi:glycosyltransferase involved in cell wall biosynthesis
MDKLVYIANARIPTEKAHGLQIMKMCEAFASVGEGAELIIPRRINSLKQDPFEFYGVKKNFKIRRLWCLDFLWLPVFKGFSFWLQSLSFVNSALWYAIFNRRSIFYTRDVLTAFFLSLGRAKVFFEIHSVPARGNYFIRKVWQGVTGLVAISEGIKRELIRQGIPSNKILIARDAVDVGQFSIAVSQKEVRKKLGLPASKKIILYTGHLYDWKGASLLAEAAPKIPADIYLVGGTNEDVARFKSKYQSPNLKIIGWQEPQSIPLWLKAADVLVLPNSAKTKIGSEYTSPLKLFEYMASGVPMVISDLPAMQEVVSEKDAFFFNPDKADSLVNMIKRVLNDEFLAKNKAALAKEKAREYTWDNRAKNILIFIKNYAR